jgi:hypothetical protein
MEGEQKRHRYIGIVARCPLERLPACLPTPTKPVPFPHAKKSNEKVKKASNAVIIHGIVCIQSTETVVNALYS